MDQGGESVTIFKIPHIQGVEVLFGRGITNAFKRHIHKTYIIGIIEHGQRIFSLPQDDIHVLKNEIFLLNPGQTHGCRSQNPSGHSYSVLSIAPELLITLASQISDSPCTPGFKAVRCKDPMLSEKFRGFLKTIHHPESDIHLEGDFYALTAHILIHHSEIAEPMTVPEISGESLDKVFRFMTRHYSENLSLRQLADLVYLSPFHFQREFTRKVGISPHEYLQGIRIGVARERLMQSRNLAAIALETGFYDQSHFCRVFKKIVGISPGKFRQCNR